MPITSRLPLSNDLTYVPTGISNCNPNLLLPVFIKAIKSRYNIVTKILEVGRHGPLLHHALPLLSPIIP